MGDDTLPVSSTAVTKVTADAGLGEVDFAATCTIFGSIYCHIDIFEKEVFFNTCLWVVGQGGLTWCHAVGLSGLETIACLANAGVGKHELFQSQVKLGEQIVTSRPDIGCEVHATRLCTAATRCLARVEERQTISQRRADRIVDGQQGEN